VTGTSSNCVHVDGSSGACGGGTSACIQTVTSSVPTFDFSVCPQAVLTLTMSITPTLTNIASCEIPGGCTLTFIQGTGNWTVTWPGNVLGAFRPGSINTKRNTQNFTTYDATNLVSTGPGTVNQ
jgi:hypothetical protein